MCGDPKALELKGLLRGDVVQAPFFRIGNRLVRFSDLSKVTQQNRSSIEQG